MNFGLLKTRFFNDESGFLLSTESLLLGTIGVLGLIVGLAEVRNAAVQELGDFSQAVAMLSQDYEYTSVTSGNVATDIETAGSSYVDIEDQQLDATFVANGVAVVSAADVE